MPTLTVASKRIPGLTRGYLIRHRVCPLVGASANSVDVATAPLFAEHAVEELFDAYCAQRSEHGTTIAVDDRELDQLIELFVMQSGHEESSQADALDDGDAALEDIRELANQPPVARYVNLLLREAYDAAASDVHLESAAHGMIVRLRRDGVLRPAPTPPQNLDRAVVSRLKAMAELDITERRRPQDGRIRLRLEQRDLDVRISTVPTVHGESVVLRLLDQGGRPIHLHELGMRPSALRIFSEAIARPHGLILLTGPTGSGKTTTLYAALQGRSAREEKIITVEEPVEYQLDGVTQVPVHRQTGMSFASALRAILRQDPDVVMVGELRDAETAEIAVQAAMTGHLVLATVHANDALGAIPRLCDLGVPAPLLAATLQAVAAQRLLRKLCSHCADPAKDAAESESPARSLQARGCSECYNTGYSGRVGVFEAYLVSEPIRRGIAAGLTSSDLHTLFATNDASSMRAHAAHLVETGVTSEAEVARVLRV